MKRLQDSSWLNPRPQPLSRTGASEEASFRRNPSRHPADDQAIECSRRALERSSMRLSALIGVRPLVRIFREKEHDARATSRESAIAVLDGRGARHFPRRLWEKRPVGRMS